MRNRTVYFEIIVFLVLAVVSSVYVIDQVGGPDPLSSGYDVTVVMENSAGLAVGSEVAYRGVTVGKVGTVTVSDDRSTVELTLALRRNVSIPGDAVAAVVQDTAAPVLKMQLSSESDGGPYLEDGSSIPRERTSVPVPLGTLITNFDAIADTVDPDELRSLAAELGDGLRGIGPELRRTVDNFGTLVRMIEVNQPKLTALTSNSRKLFDANEDNVQALPQIAQSLRQITDQVRDADPDIRALLDRTPSILANQVAPLLEENREPFALLLTNSVTSSQIVAARIPALDALLVAVPNGFNRLGSVVKDGRAQLNLITAVGPVCFYDTERRSVQDTSPTELNRDQHCTDHSGDVQQRGSQNVPHPAGDPGDFSGITSYDPGSGRIPTGDGTAVRMGLSGGQQQILGDQSWAALLLQGTQ
ncbi:MlaD family protein [Rhodococcus jostii]|uniref:Phospholipid/cholesterol/gamma-HCH transport system substrate-binding protein n=1 Tax=Rhodococcus jostii TaxID=132919 RepID=A0A1H5BS39_RHOJO|nr:MlaD family protein [Rhodococcus jostii]SED57413.1 phospholipid/cholesterol/gamma-HCH transport system substrate-binding protein [Rhodococcus jostii]